MGSEPSAQPAAAEAPDEERTQCRQRRPDRDSVRPSDSETEKDDVAGHIRDKDMAEPQIADRIDQAGDNGQ
jgi:hypothetical protein